MPEDRRSNPRRSHDIRTQFTFPMKTKMMILAALFVGAASLTAAEKIVGGPKGGRLLEADGQKAEFFVNKDRKAEVIFYDANLKEISPGDRVVTMTAEPKAGRTPVTLEKNSSGYVSTAPLPEGDPYRVVVQLRPKPDAKPHNFRIDFNREICGECKRAEYACTCEGG